MKKVLDFNAATYIVNLIKKFFVKKTDIPLNIETTDNKVNTLVDANTELYPSTKGVKNYIDTVLSNINKTIADNKKLIDTNTSDISTLRNTVHNKVSSSDYATTSTGGTVKIPGSTGGISISSSGVINVRAATETQIAAKSSSVLPIVPSRLDYAVKTSLTTNTYTLTNDESQKVMLWIGLYNSNNLSNSKIVYFNTTELYTLKFHDSDTGKCSAEFWHSPSEGFFFEFKGEEGDRCFYLDFGEDGFFPVNPTNGKLDFNNKNLTGIATPTAKFDAANKQYVDNIVGDVENLLKTI